MDAKFNCHPRYPRLSPAEKYYIMAEISNPIAEIDHGPSKLDQFLDRHTPKLVIGAILIALAVIGYVIYSGLAEAEAEEAGSALYAANTATEYQEVISKWPDSEAAASAQLLLAGVQWEDSKDEAVSTLQSFISEHPEHSAAATAKVSLGLRQLAQGKNDEAVSTLTEVANDESAAYIAPLAQITLGDIAKAAGDTEGAKTWYEKAAEDNTGQGNTYADTASARLQLVNAVPPTKVKPTAPAPAVPPAAPAAAGSTPSPAPTLPPLVAPDQDQPATQPADAPDAEGQSEEPQKPAENLNEGPR